MSKISLTSAEIPSVDWIVQFDPPDDPRVSYQNHLVCSKPRSLSESQ